MATEIIMPALGMAQETGLLVSWLKREGETVSQGEPIMEVETDKATVEIEAPASGTLGQVSAHEGDVVPVGQTIALILAPGEALPSPSKENKPEHGSRASRTVAASPVARKIAEEHGLDLAQVKSNGERITKEDVLSHLSQVAEHAAGNDNPPEPGGRMPASPKARRLAAERGLELAGITGSGPGGAVIAQDVLSADPSAAAGTGTPGIEAVAAATSEPVSEVSATWRVMAERMAASWTSAPHFYLVREVKAGALIEMRERITPRVEKLSDVRPTYTDLLVRIIAAVLRDHPRLLGSWTGAGIRPSHEINIGLAVGIEDGLVVPVIHQADALGVGELALQRQDLVRRAGEHKLRQGDLSGGTFTLTNLGMYNVDAFMAVLNPPQAAILAVGRIAERVIPENGVPVIRPMMTLTLSCDHRVVDGLRAAQFLDDLAKLIEEPWGLLA